MRIPSSNDMAVARRLSTSTTQCDQLVRYAKSCIKPGYDYFKQKFDKDLSIALNLNMFKCLRLFDPSFVVDAHPVYEDIDELRLLPYFNSNSTIDNLKRELPTCTLQLRQMFSLKLIRQTGEKKADKLLNGPMHARKRSSAIVCCIQELFLFCQILFLIGKNSL